MYKRVLALVLSLMLVSLSALSLAEGTFSMAGYDAEDSHNWANNHALERIEERSGVHFTYNQYTDTEEWTNAKKAMTKDSADLPDVLFKASLTQDEAQELYDRGVLIDLRPYLEEYAPNLSALLKEHPDWESAITLADGAIVALPNLNPLQNNNALWINTVWLNNLHLSVPTTAEELTEVLRAFKTGDPNKNGKKDEIPLTFIGMWDLRWLGHAFGIYSNDYYVTLEDGTVRQTVTTDENRAFLTWLHQLWEEELIDHDGFSSTTSSKQITDSSSDITYGIVMGASVMDMLPTEQLDNYDVLLPLTYNGKQVYRKLLGDVSYGTFAVTSACSDPAAMVAWVDFFYTEEGCYLTQAGEKDSEYEVYSDGSWHWLAEATEISETILPDYTIASGTLMPGYTPVEYQLLYDDTQTQRAVKQLASLNEYSVYPCPMLALTTEARARLNELWPALGTYCETMMARFVSGDVALNDTTWAEFCAEAERLGLSEMVSIWQSAVK